MNKTKKPTRKDTLSQMIVKNGETNQPDSTGSITSKHRTYNLKQFKIFDAFGFPSQPVPALYKFI